MNIKKTLKAALAALLCAATFTACSAGGNSGSSSVQNSSADSDTSAVSDVSSDSEAADSSDASDSTDTSAAESIRVAALKGPTAMGMTKLMSDDETENYPYEFTIAAAVDEISPMIAQGTVDIACVPANLGAVLYSKTEGKVQTLAVNTLGVLYIVENGESVNTVADLKGKTIYSAGKGATPEYALNFILTSNGLDVEKDVNIEWKSEHAECLAALLADENSVAMLPQPFVTTAQAKNEGVRVALDLNNEWDNLGVASSLLTGIVIARKDFVEQNPDAVKEFLSRYKDSVDYVNGNIDEAAALIEKYDIVPAAVAKKAIPECNIVCITGEEMKTKLSGYLQVLFDQLPQSVGGAMPADDFYFIAG